VECCAQGCHRGVVCGERFPGAWRTAHLLVVAGGPAGGGLAEVLGDRDVAQPLLGREGGAEDLSVERQVVEDEARSYRSRYRVDGRPAPYVAYIAHNLSAIWFSIGYSRTLTVAG